MGCTFNVRLRKLMCEEKLTRVKMWYLVVAERTADETKAMQVNKLEKLRNRKMAMSLDPKRVVVNISKRTLSEDEERVLTLAPKISPI